MSGVDYPSEPIKDWKRDPNKNKHEEKGIYSVGSLTRPYWLIYSMVCRLFSYPNTQKFLDHWTPLSDKLATHILYFRRKHTVLEGIICPFYMSAYVMDALCYNMNFSTMGWKLEDSGLKAQDAKIKELQQNIEKLKVNPELEEFKKEVGE